MNIFAWIVFILLLLLFLSCEDGSSQPSYRKKTSNKHVGKDFILRKLMLLSGLEDGHSFNKTLEGKQLMEFFSLKVDKNEFNETFCKETFCCSTLIMTYDENCNWCKFIKTVDDWCKKCEKLNLGCLKCHQNLCVKNVNNFDKCIKMIKNNDFLSSKLIVVFCSKKNCKYLQSLKETRNLKNYMNYTNEFVNETAIISLPYFADNNNIDLISNKCVELLTLKKVEDLIIIDTRNLNYLFNSIKSGFQLFKNRININNQNVDCVLSLHNNKHHFKNWFSFYNFQGVNLNKNYSFNLFPFSSNDKIFLIFNCSSVPRTFQNTNFVLLCSSKELSKMFFHKRKSQKTHPFTSRLSSSASPVIIPLSKYISSAFTAKVKREIGSYKIMKELRRTKINKGIPNGKLEIIKNFVKYKRLFSENRKKKNKYFPQKEKKQIDSKNGTAFQGPLFKGRTNDEKNRKKEKWPAKNNARGKRAANFIPKEESLAYLDPFFPPESKKELFDQQNEKLETKESEIESLRANSLEPARKTHLRHLRSKRRKGEKSDIYFFGHILFSNS